jgi:hypothetical protein
MLTMSCITPFYGTKQKRLKTSPGHTQAARNVTAAGIFKRSICWFGFHLRIVWRIVFICYRYYNIVKQLSTSFFILVILFTNKRESTMNNAMKTLTVGVRMPAELKEKLQKLADEEMRSLSNLMVKMLTECLEEHNKTKPKK